MQRETTDRRRFLTRLSSGILVATLSADAFAEALDRTPWATEGPFYPYNRLPLDRDNDLMIIGKDTTAAVGTVVHLTGRVLDQSGEPVPGAQVEIWQTDARGVYLASRDRDSGADVHFQGWGRFETASDGAYRFRTIRPVVYPGRSAPHIHVRVSAKGRIALTTQLFIKGHPGNARDGVFAQLGGAPERERVAREFLPVKGSTIGEQAVGFDIVLGATPREGERGGFNPGGRPPREGFGRRPL